MWKNGTMYCPHCGGMLETEIMDNEWYDESYIDNMMGKCSVCHKIYQWSEIYRFTDIEDFQEITES